MTVVMVTDAYMVVTAYFMLSENKKKKNTTSHSNNFCSVLNVFRVVCNTAKLLAVIVIFAFNTIQPRNHNTETKLRHE